MDAHAQELADTLQRVYDNYTRIWLLCTEVVANPTQANVDTLTAEAEGNATLRAKLTYSLDGESYDWTAFQQALEGIMAGVRKQMVFSAGPFEIRSTVR